MTVVQAAEMLGVSERQCWRLLARYRASGCGRTGASQPGPALAAAPAGGGTGPSADVSGRRLSGLQRSTPDRRAPRGARPADVPGQRAPAAAGAGWAVRTSIGGATAISAGSAGRGPVCCCNWTLPIMIGSRAAVPGWPWRGRSTMPRARWSVRCSGNRRMRPATSCCCAIGQSTGCRWPSMPTATPSSRIPQSQPRAGVAGRAAPKPVRPSVRTADRADRRPFAPGQGTGRAPLATLQDRLVKELRQAGARTWSRPIRCWRPTSANQPALPGRRPSPSRPSARCRPS